MVNTSAVSNAALNTATHGQQRLKGESQQTWGAGDNIHPFLQSWAGQLVLVPPVCSSPHRQTQAGEDAKWIGTNLVCQ